MDDSSFEKIAEAVLANLFERIDVQLGDFLEVDFQNGILEIEMPGGGGAYIVNKHTANREIWLSSPKSGAWHFRPGADGRWQSTRGGAEAPDLMRLLAEELASASGRPVSL